MTAARFAAASALLLVGWEWLFYATKPSMLSGASPAVYLAAFLLPGLLGILIASFPVVVLSFLSPRLSRLAGAGIGGAILGVTSVVVIDSILYSGLGIGSLYTDGGARWLASAALLFLVCRWGWVGLRFKDGSEALPWFAVLAVFVGGVSLRFPVLTPRSSDVASAQNPINIILLGSDGLDPAEMGVFNSTLLNTPNLSQLSSQMVVCDRAYANANRSAGSVVSMLTGRLPFETRVVNYPDLLLPELAYDHLPGILRQNGYYTYESSMRGYADSFDLNIRDGFIEANGRRLSNYEIPILSRYREIFASIEYNFALTLVNDVLNRVQHLLFIQKFRSIFQLVKTGEGLKDIDTAGMDRLIELLKQASSERPLFAHMHLLGTHGPGFKPESSEATPYRAAIKDFDLHIGRLFEALESYDLLKNTLILIYSDHDSKNSLVSEIPMLFYFPGGKLAGERRADCQLLDVAPTVLQGANLSVPSYMKGRAVQGDFSPTPIYTVSDFEKIEAWNYKKPPFYQFGGGAVISCGVRTSVVFPSKEARVVGDATCDSPLEGSAAIDLVLGLISSGGLGG